MTPFIRSRPCGKLRFIVAFARINHRLPALSRKCSAVFSDAFVFSDVFPFTDAFLFTDGSFDEGERRRILVTYDEVPEHVVNAFIAAEDRRFWVHPGIDYRGLLRALFQLVSSGEVEAGGSTLTQQLARSYFLSLDRTIERKFKEGALAVRIEKEFSKEQIMALFLILVRHTGTMQGWVGSDISP